MLEMNINENKELLNWSETYEAILKDKNSQISLKDKQIKKYQSQMLEALSKNEDLTTYSRKLANKYNDLLYSIKDNTEAMSYKEMISEGKLNAVEGQLSYLRADILERFKKEETFKKEAKKKRRKNSLISKK